MAFTSRAIRQTGVFKTATPKEVGPGSYDFALSGKAEQVRGRAPFSSTVRAADVLLPPHGQASHQIKI